MQWLNSGNNWKKYIKKQEQFRFCNKVWHTKSSKLSLKNKLNLKTVQNLVHRSHLIPFRNSIPLWTNTKRTWHSLPLHKITITIRWSKIPVFRRQVKLCQTTRILDRQRVIPIIGIMEWIKILSISFKIIPTSTITSISCRSRSSKLCPLFIRLFWRHSWSKFI